MSLRGNTKSDQVAVGVVSTNQGVTGFASAYQAVKGKSIRLPEKGDKGDPGVSVTHEWNGTTLIVTSASGTSYADLKGEKGDPGVVTEKQVADAVAAYMAENQTSSATIGDVTLLASAWKGNESPYSQVVQISGVTNNSQVDLTPSIEQLAIFHHKDLAFVTENVDGVVTVYALGDKPLNDYTIQVTITEVYL